jgi:hypothetical protein
MSILNQRYLHFLDFVLDTLSFFFLLIIGYFFERNSDLPFGSSNYAQQVLEIDLNITIFFFVKNYKKKKKNLPLHAQERALIPLVVKLDRQKRE